MLESSATPLNKYITQFCIALDPSAPGYDDNSFHHRCRMAGDLMSRSLVCFLLLTACSGAAYAQSADDESLSRGVALFRDCAACHGKDGGGVADGTVPAIGGQPAEVVVRQLQAFRASQRVDLRMQHFSDDEHLEGDTAVAAVAAYVAGLQRTTPVALGSGLNLDLGEKDFRRHCAVCHGADGGAVAARGIPALAGQHAPFLLRKLRDAGSASGEFGRIHAGVVSRLAPERIDSVADWLARRKTR